MADTVPWEIDDTVPWEIDDTVPQPVLKKSKGLSPLLTINPLTQAKGLAEAATQMATGTASQAVGGLLGIGSLATGGSHEDATRWVKGAEQAMTYQPRTEHGQAVSELVAWPMEKLAKGGKYLGKAIGGDAGESIGEVAPALALTMAGGAGALKSAKGVGKPLDRNYFKPGPATPDQVAASRANVHKIDAANAARKYDIAIDPTEVNPTIGNKLRKSLAGGEGLTDTLAIANKDKWSKPLKDELGMELNAPITMEALEAVHQRALAPNRQIAQMGTLTPDAEVISAINSLRPKEPLIGGKPSFMKQSARVDEALGSLSGEASAAQVLENIAQLRKEARDIYNMQDAGRARLAVADTNIGIANALENMIERNLQSAGKTELMQQYHKGHTDLAKSYILEKVTDLNTGQVVPSRLSNLTSKDNALTGSYAELGKVAGNFPNLTKTRELTPALLQEHFSRYTIPGVVGGVAGSFISPGWGTMGGAIGGNLVANALRKRYGKMIASPEYQAKHAKPQDFRPQWEQQGLAAEPIAPVPLSLAPVGEALPTTRVNVEPQVRSTLELADMDAPFAPSALRGARTPLNGDPVEFTPGARQQFPLRQEVMQQPEISAAIDKFVERAATLEQQVANAQGFWKQRYQAELDALRVEFGAGMEMLGVRNPQEALGLQNLYEGQAQGRLPVVKTFDPRAEALRRR